MWNEALYLAALFREGSEQLKKFAAKARLSHTLVLETARETVKAFAQVWPSISDFKLDDGIVQSINEHLRAMPLYRG